MAATGGIAPGIGGVRTEIARPMDVITVLLDVFVDVRVDRFGAHVATGHDSGDRVGAQFAVASRFRCTDSEMFAPLAFDARAVNHMPEVRDDAHLRPKLAVFIEINSPGI